MSLKIAAAEDCVQQELLTQVICQDQKREGRFSPIRYAGEKIAPSYLISDHIGFDTIAIPSAAIEVMARQRAEQLPGTQTRHACARLSRGSLAKGG